VYHSGIVLAHALMSAGTTSDAFLRDNLEWLSRATNWAKFSATATLGVIHKGHVKQALQLLQPYLPQAGMSASAYSEGGALFALGIIHANHGTEIRSYLLDALRNAGTNEVVQVRRCHCHRNHHHHHHRHLTPPSILQHGAALGIGIAAMGTEDDALYEELKVHCRAILRNSAQFWRNSGAILRNSL
jgi:26S proteasome regulatory subunit N2